MFQENLNSNSHKAHKSNFVTAWWEIESFIGNLIFKSRYKNQKIGISYLEVNEGNSLINR